MTAFAATGTVSGSGVVLDGGGFSPDIIQTVTGTVVLTAEEYAEGLWLGAMTFAGTGSSTGWAIDSYNWSGAASSPDEDPGFMIQTGSALEFSAIAYPNGIHDNSTTFLWIVVNTHLNVGGSIVFDNAEIRYGDDTLIGGSISSFLPLFDGTSGNDTLTGGADDEIFQGGAGNDVINAGGGNDTVFAGAGADTVSGGAGKDSIDGGAGNDSIDGGLGNDILYAQDGNDKVAGGDGNDELVGGSGKGDDRYTGGLGIDTLRYSSAAHSVTANLATGRGSGLDIGNDTIASVENLIGGKGADKLLGDAQDNVLTGGDGNDTLKGGAGHDRLVGGNGADKIFYAEAPLASNSDTIVGFGSTDIIQLDDVVFVPLRNSGTLSVTEFNTYFDYVGGKLYYDADGAGSGLHKLMAEFVGAPTLTASDFVVI
jgi:Ca2+-binding RTX toxin-like protein